MRYDLSRVECRDRSIHAFSPGETSTMRAIGPWQLSAVSLLIAVLLVSAGCSISASSKSSSESSESSSGSSSPESKETQYRNDVRDYTASYVKSGGQIEDFRKRLGDLAKERGITDWEQNLVTYDGIGRGLGKAKVSQVELDTYATNLAGSDPAKAKAIKDGYDAGKDE